jgi:ribosomal protein S18 acetylase RimI-like enzyme
MVQIRNAHEDDVDTIVSFQMAMAKETENITLNEKNVWQGVVNVIHDVQKGKYYLAQDNDVVVGSLLITKEWSDWRNRWVLWIQSVYVLPQYRGKGVFKQMYNHIKKLAEENEEVAGIRLYVDKSNKNAIKVYEKLGMNGEHYKVFEWMK